MYSQWMIQQTDDRVSKIIDNLDAMYQESEEILSGEDVPLEILNNSAEHDAEKESKNALWFERERSTESETLYPGYPFSRG